MFNVLVKVSAALLVISIYLLLHYIYNLINKYLKKRKLCLFYINNFINNNKDIFARLLELPSEFINKSKKKITLKNVNKYCKKEGSEEIMSLIIISIVAEDKFYELLDYSLPLPDIYVYREIFVKAIKDLQEKGFYQRKAAEAMIGNIESIYWAPPTKLF